jgi:hypothetical protein
MLINQDYVLGAYESAVFRVLGDTTVVAAWVESTTDQWAPPYKIKKAISQDGGATWNTSELLSQVPFTITDWNYQCMAIDSIGNIYYAGSGTKTGHPGEWSLHLGIYNGTSWSWTELLQFDAWSTYCIRFDGLDRPYLLSGTSNSDQHILHFDGTTWVDEEANTRTWSMFVSQDGTIHTLYVVPNGHKNSWDMDDQWYKYYSKKVNGSWTTPILISTMPVEMFGGDISVDIYGNVHMLCGSYNEDWQMTNYYVKLSCNGDISDLFPIGDNSAWSETPANIGCFFPNQKIYFCFFDADEDWNYPKARLRVLNTLTNVWEDISDLLNVATGHSFYSNVPLCLNSHYNGWGVLLVSYRLSPPQLQRLDLLLGTEEPTTFTPKQLFELEGTKTNHHNGLCEQNVDCMTCSSYWRHDGYPETMTDDMEQVAVFKQKNNNQHNEINIYTFYVGNHNNGEFPLDQFDFVGYFWRNRLLD